MSVKTSFSNSADHVYYNVGVTNNTNQPIKAQFSEVRTDALIDKPDDWYLSIVRFTIPTNLVPMFLFEPNTLSVTLSYNGVDAQAYLINYAPDYPDFPNYIYSIEYFVDMINTAFYEAFLVLFPGYNLPTGTPAPVNTNPPYMIFDPVEQLFSVIADSTYQFVNPASIWPWPGHPQNNTHYAIGPDQQQNPNWNGVTIHMNFKLYQFFNNLTATVHGYSQPNGKDVHIEITDNSNWTVPPPNNIPAGRTIIKMTQQAVNTASLYLPRALQFLTGSLPIRAESLPGGDQNRLILTDFEFNVSENVADIRGYVQYFPQGPYRYIDLKGSDPLKIIDFQIFWTDSVERIHPLYIPVNDTFTIKFLFRRKTDGKYI